MKAVILAGGEGTRLRPLTDTVPKPLLPIANRPFLEHQLRWLARHGVRDSMLLTGYLTDAFLPFAERVSRELGLTLRVERESEPVGTAGAVRRVLDRLDGTTLVFNGDILTDLDLDELVGLHRRCDAVLSIALTPVADATGYGLVRMDDAARILEFVEKPPPEVAAAGGAINAGTYVLEPRALADVPPGVWWSFERQVFPGLVQRGERICGLVSDAYWIDIGTPERFRAAHRDALDGRAPVEPAGRMVSEGDGAPALIGEGARVAPDARVGPYAVLGPSARVGAGARVRDSVLFEGASVGERATVQESILGVGATVPPGATVRGAVIGDGRSA